MNKNGEYVEQNYPNKENRVGALMMEIKSDLIDIVKLGLIFLL